MGWKSPTYVSTICVVLYPSDMYLFQLLVAITFLFSCSRLGLAFGTRDAYHFFIMHSLPGYMLQLLLRNLQKYNRILYFMAVKNLFIMVNYCEMQFMYSPCIVYHDLWDSYHYCRCWWWGNSSSSIIFYITIMIGRASVRNVL